MEKFMSISFHLKEGFLEVWDNEKHEDLFKGKVYGVDRDKLADVVGDILRCHFFAWCD